jgi:hypothetical protein
MCLFNNEQDACNALSKTTGHCHPGHAGVCFGIFEEKDPIWNDASQGWTLVRRKAKFYKCFEQDPLVTSQAPQQMSSLNKQAKQDLEVDKLKT